MLYLVEHIVINVKKIMYTKINETENFEQKMKRGNWRPQTNFFKRKKKWKKL